MNLHFQPLGSLLPLLALSTPAVAQPGLYGPITTHIKAGDSAPDITFSRLLSSPSAGSWSQNNLTGQLTVIVFMPNTSANLQTVTFWNATVEKFAGKPVQFLWITGEKEATLNPWLKLDQHPVSGWLFHDPAGQTGSAYGLDLPVSVYIAPDRKILGFTFPMVDQRTIDAALDGRITTTPQTRETMPAFMAANLVLLDAEPHRMPRPPDAHRPSFPPSFSPSTSRPPPATPTATSAATRIPQPRRATPSKRPSPTSTTFPPSASSSPPPSTTASATTSPWSPRPNPAAAKGSTPGSSTASKSTSTSPPATNPASPTSTSSPPTSATHPRPNPSEAPRAAAPSAAQGPPACRHRKHQQLRHRSLQPMHIVGDRPDPSESLTSALTPFADLSRHLGIE